MNNLGEIQEVDVEEVKTLTPLEHDKLKNLQSVENEIQNELIAVGKLEFEFSQRKLKLTEKMIDSVSSQNIYFQEIEKKYGKVKLDIETGEVLNK